MLTGDKVTSIYCIADDMLKGVGHRKNSNRKVSDSEVLSTGIISALYFGGHQDQGL